MGKSFGVSTWASWLEQVSVTFSSGSWAYEDTAWVISLMRLRFIGGGIPSVLRLAVGFGMVIRFSFGIGRRFRNDTYPETRQTTPWHIRSSRNL